MFFYSKDAMGHNTGSQTLYIPYVGVAIAVLVLAAIFFFANIPDIKTEDDYHLDDAPPGASHSIWSHPHFVLAVAAQFFYVAAQAGIFSFFINYMTTEVPSLPSCLGIAAGLSHGWFESGANGVLPPQRQGRVQPGLAGLDLLSGGPVQRRRDAAKVLGAQGARALRGHERGLPAWSFF